MELFKLAIPFSILFGISLGVSCRAESGAAGTNLSDAAIVRDAVCKVESQAGRRVFAPAFAAALREKFPDDREKIAGLQYALMAACRVDLLSLAPTPEYVALLRDLSSAREEFEANGSIGKQTLAALEGDGVSRKEIPSRTGGPAEWQLVISLEAKRALKIRNAVDLSTFGSLYVEAYHALAPFPEFADARKVLLYAIERSAREIMDNSDANGDGIVGWGRLWIRGDKGELLHTSLPAQILYFGGNTYFPRADAKGKDLCEHNLALREEAFDHDENDRFLLEAFLATRDRDLAEHIVRVVGKSLDDNFDIGGSAGPGGTGWYYRKVLGRGRGTGLPQCDSGRQIKNTSFRLGVVLRLFGEILKRNGSEPAITSARLDAAKYLRRADAVISTNDWEIFSNNNFGYQGRDSRSVELAQEPGKQRLMYDRTQIDVELGLPFLSELNDIIRVGNSVAGRPTVGKVTICSGAVDGPPADRGLGGSCWEHLPFEAEDYFRLMRYAGVWSGSQSGRELGYLDAMVRNLAATNVVLAERKVRYAHFFPDPATGAEGMMGPVQFAYFCMGRKLSGQGIVQKLPAAHQKFIGKFAPICGGVPAESDAPGAPWRRGYKYYELYLMADYLQVQADDWLLARKAPASSQTVK
ncbi:MAG: hypothetical protein KF778_22650 [Rhodocyclaceae bacterium]|nr:hypothetical protein [Rhodocyclaceae bacterium]